MTQKAKRKSNLRFADGFTIVASVFLLVLLFKNSQLASEEVVKALRVCFMMLIPSLFPLTVAAEIATETGAVEYVTKRFRAPIAKILGISPSATVPYFLGLLGGYTASCKSAVALYQRGSISKRDCESVIALSNIPSLAFLTGFVGIGIFKSSTIGWILWGITVSSTLILGIFNRIISKKESSREEPSAPQAESCQAQKGFSKIFVEAIAHSAHAMLIICACVVFFSVLIAVLKFAAGEISISQTLQDLTLGALEITYGVSSCSDIEGYITRAAVCSFFIGWSGACVHFQVISLCEDADISFKRYFLLKILQGLICSFLAWMIFKAVKI